MSRHSRRRALRLVGLAAGTGFAGCLGGPGSEPTDGSQDETPRPSTDGGTETHTGPDGTRYAVLQVGPSLAAPGWYPDGEPPGFAALFGDGDAAAGWLSTRESDEETREQIGGFVDGTDFSTERLLYLGSVGPDTCHDRVEVSSLAVEGGSLVGDAAAAADDGVQGCGDAITYPAALVRARPDGSPPDRASVAITDGWGDSATVEADVGGASVDSAHLPGFTWPEGDPPMVPAGLACEDAAFQRLGEGFDGTPPRGVARDEDGTPAFALRVGQREYGRGEAVRVSLTNLGPGERFTGNRHKYNLQVRTGDGWQDVRGYTGQGFHGYTDEGIAHHAGRGFEWTFELTEAGVVADDSGGNVTVCPGLPAGRYRFVFWEPAVAVGFDLLG